MPLPPGVECVCLLDLWTSRCAYGRITSHVWNFSLNELCQAYVRVIRFIQNCVLACVVELCMNVGLCLCVHGMQGKRHVMLKFVEDLDRLELVSCLEWNYSNKLLLMPHQNISRLHVCVHTYTCSKIHILHTCLHTYMQTHKKHACNMRTNMHILKANKQTYVRSFIHAYFHEYNPTESNIWAHAHIHMYTYVHKNIRTNNQTETHTCVHTEFSIHACS